MMAQKCPGILRPSGYCVLLSPLHLRAWRNWQTRMVQVHVGATHEGSSPFARTIAKTQAPDFGSGLFCCGAVWLSSLPNTTTNVVVEFSPNYAIGERTCRTWLARPAEKRDPMNIKPSASIRQNYNEVAELCRATGEPVYLTKNGEGDLVVMDIASFSRREKMLALRERLLSVEEDRARGVEDIPLDEVCASMERAISLNSRRRA